MEKLLEKTLPIGTTVKVNCYLGRITGVTTGIESIDPVTRLPITVPLTNPIYHVHINTRKAYSRVEEARYIWLRKGRNNLRLFADEFEVIAKPQFMDTSEVIRRFSAIPGYACAS